MADINLKTLADIPVVEPNESTHLLAEQDGAYARIPKDKVGVTSWNDLPDRPFGEEKTVIEWDGVVGDRVSVTLFEFDDNYARFVKVAESMRIDQIVGSTFRLKGDSRFGFPEEVHVTEDYLAEEEGVTLVMATPEASAPMCLVVPHSGAMFEGFEFPESGLYFYAASDAGETLYVSGFENTTVKQLDPKFIPSSVGGGALVVNVTPSSDMQTGTADVDVNAVIAAITAGQYVSARIVGESGIMVLQPSSVAEDMVVFDVFVGASGEAYTVMMRDGVNCFISVRQIAES